MWNSSAPYKTETYQLSVFQSIPSPELSDLLLRTMIKHLSDCPGKLHYFTFIFWHPGACLKGKAALEYCCRVIKGPWASTVGVVSSASLSYPPQPWQLMLLGFFSVVLFSLFLAFRRPDPYCCTKKNLPNFWSSCTVVFLFPILQISRFSSTCWKGIY